MSKIKSITHVSKDIANGKVENRQTDKKTGQKQDAIDQSIRGQKKNVICKVDEDSRNLMTFAFIINTIVGYLVYCAL